MLESRYLGAVDYPAGPVRLILGFPPGGGGDVIARIVAAQLSGRLGQQVVVEYRPGAGSGIALRQMLNSPADGRTLLLMGGSAVIYALLHELDEPKLLQEILPVAGLTVSPFVVVAHSLVPQTTLPDLIAYAASNPREIRVGTYGLGTQSHLAAQSFCKNAGVDVVLVPYRGSAPMMKDLLGRHIEVAFDSVASALPHVQSGALRALAVTGQERLNNVLPGVPAAAEVLADYEAVMWNGIAVRSGTQSDIVMRLHDECMRALNDPAVNVALENLALDTMKFSRAEFSAFWSNQVTRSRRYIEQPTSN